MNEKKKVECLFNTVFDLQKAGYSNEEVSRIFQNVAHPDLFKASLDIELMALGFSSTQADFIQNVIYGNFGVYSEPVGAVSSNREDLFLRCSCDDIILHVYGDGTVSTESDTLSEEEIRDYLIVIGDFLRKDQEECDSPKGITGKASQVTLRSSVTSLMRCLLNCISSGLKLLISRLRNSRT